MRDATDTGRSTLRRWWDQEDLWEWTTAFLESRELLGSAKKLIAFLAMSTVLAPVVLAASWTSLSRWGDAFVVATFTFSVLDTAFWIWAPWPGRRASATSTLLGSVVILGWTLVQPNAVLALLGCAAMTVSGVYLAYFHSVKLLVLNAALASVAVGFAAVRVAERDPAVAFGASWLILLLALAIPACIRAIARAVQSGVRNSHYDALTLVLNRRGLTHTLALPRVARALAHRTIAAMVVDLDRFKTLNDTRGHSVGDQVLVEVARVLTVTAPDAIVCRLGGEEFLVLQACDVDRARTLAEELRGAIAGIDPQVSASVGLATATVDGRGVTEAVHALLGTADGAMYVAKAEGGDRVHVVR